MYIYLCIFLYREEFNNNNFNNPLLTSIENLSNNKNLNHFIHRYKFDFDAKDICGKKFMNKQKLFLSILYIFLYIKYIKICDCKCHYNSLWSYDDQSNWSSFRNYYNLYKTPININTEKTIGEKNKLSIHYSNVQELYSLENIKFIEYATKNEDSYIIYNDNKYILDQFHFHNSSENTKNDIYYPLECHFVHKYHNEIDNQDYILVIGLLFSLSNEIGSEITHNITENFGKDVVFDLSVYNNLIHNQYYHFIGTLTTPPFTPNINFNLFFHDDVKDSDKINFKIKEKDYFNYLKYFPNNRSNYLSTYNSNRISTPLDNNFISVKLISP